MFKYYMGWKYLKDTPQSENELGVFIFGLVLIVSIMYFAIRSTR